MQEGGEGADDGGGVGEFVVVEGLGGGVDGLDGGAGEAAGARQVGEGVAAEAGVVEDDGEAEGVGRGEEGFGEVLGGVVVAGGDGVAAGGGGGGGGGGGVVLGGGGLGSGGLGAGGKRGEAGEDEVKGSADLGGHDADFRGGRRRRHEIGNEETLTRQPENVIGETEGRNEDVRRRAEGKCDQVRRPAGRSNPMRRRAEGKSEQLRQTEGKSEELVEGGMVELRGQPAQQLVFQRHCVDARRERESRRRTWPS